MQPSSLQLSVLLTDSLPLLALSSRQFNSKYINSKRSPFTNHFHLCLFTSISVSQFSDLLTWLTLSIALSLSLLSFIYASDCE